MNCPTKRLLFIFSWVDHDWKTTWVEEMNWDLPKYEHPQRGDG